MASKRHKRRKSCTGKRRYDSLEAATRSSKQAAYLSGQRISAYKCRFCGGYHIGHTPRHLIRVIRARQQGASNA